MIFKKVSIILFSFILCITLAIFVEAKRVRTDKNDIEQKEFSIEEMYISQTNMPFEQLIDKLPNKDVWLSFIKSREVNYIYLDPRSGRPTSVINVIPFIPGDGVGNKLTLRDISEKLGYEINEIDEEVVGRLVLQFLKENADLMRLDITEVGEVRVSAVTDFLWQIYITRKHKGIPVRSSNIVMSINNGNLVLWGMEKWGGHST